MNSALCEGAVCFIMVFWSCFIIFVKQSIKEIVDQMFKHVETQQNVLKLTAALS